MDARRRQRVGDNLACGPCLSGQGGRESAGGACKIVGEFYGQACSLGQRLGYEQHGEVAGLAGDFGLVGYVADYLALFVAGVACWLIARVALFGRQGEVACHLVGGLGGGRLPRSSCGSGGECPGAVHSAYFHVGDFAGEHVGCGHNLYGGEGVAEVERHVGRCGVGACGHYVGLLLDVGGYGICYLR
ncbi:hypothetical protein IMSAG192_01591 [Muribaculaceae bacterium]|nr:hypothetical protein IMSAG192_01591 [Muribaculaceae bacterium]